MEGTVGEAWIKLEFDRKYFIHRVIIYNRFYNNWFTNGPCGLTIEKYESCVDYQKDVEVSVYQGQVKQKSCGTIQPTYGREQTEQIYTLICNAEGDTLKLSRENSGKFMIWEIVVTGPGKSSYFRESLEFLWRRWKFFTQSCHCSIAVT